jgi:hypothetical protein
MEKTCHFRGKNISTRQKKAARSCGKADLKKRRDEKRRTTGREEQLVVVVVVFDETVVFVWRNGTLRESVFDELFASVLRRR